MKIWQWAVIIDVVWSLYEWNRIYKYEPRMEWLIASLGLDFFVLGVALIASINDLSESNKKRNKK